MTRIRILLFCAGLLLLVGIAASFWRTPRHKERPLQSVSLQKLQDADTLLAQGNAARAAQVYTGLLQDRSV